MNYSYSPNKETVLVPVAKPPHPSKLFNQSSYDRIRLLLSLHPKLSEDTTPICFSTFTPNQIGGKSARNANGGGSPNRNRDKYPQDTTSEQLNLFDGTILVNVEEPKSHNSHKKSDTSLKDLLKTANEQKYSAAGKRSARRTPQLSEESNVDPQAKKIKSTKSREVESSSTVPAACDSIRKHTISKDFHSSTLEIRPEAFVGTGSVCRNTGTNQRSLQALLAEVCMNGASLVLSCVWSDLTSNHASTTVKHCTPSVHCKNWYCACDRHIRALRGYTPLLGVTILVVDNDADSSSSSSSQSNNFYLLPLAPCTNHKSSDWRPPYDPAACDKFTLPLQCDTSLEQRWEALMQILTADVKKIIFHAQLFLLPVLAGCLHRRRTSTDGGAEWTHLPIRNVVDPRICAHLLMADVSDPQLELQALATHFISRDATDVHTSCDVIGADGPSDPSPFTLASSSHTSSSIGSVGRCLQTVAREAAVLGRVWVDMQCRLQQFGSETVLLDVEMPLVRILAEMELRGVAVCREELVGMRHRVCSALTALSATANSLTGSHINLASPEQVAVALYDKLNLPAPAIQGNQKHASTSEEDLLRIVDMHPVVAVVLDYRCLAKISSTNIDGLEPFLIALPSSEGRRVHARWNQTSVRTGRLSCCLPNLQNIPKHVTACRSCSVEVNTRDMFEASAGCVLVSADYSQVEMRVLAHVSGDAELRALFHRQGDVYRHLASIIFDKDAEQVDSAERERAKVICLGVMYGMGPLAAAARLGITVPAVNKITNTFFDKFKTMKTWLQQTKTMAHRQGFVATLLGRRRLLPDLSSSLFAKRSQAERQAVNTIIQGTASEIIKSAMLFIDDELRRQQSEALSDRLRDQSCPSSHNVHQQRRRRSPELILQIHDELIYEVDVSADFETLHSFVALLKSYMEIHVKESLQLSVPLLVNVQTGRRWGDMTPYKLPCS